MVCGLHLFLWDRPGLHDREGAQAPQEPALPAPPALFLHAQARQMETTLRVFAHVFPGAWDLHSPLFSLANPSMSFKIPLSCHSSRRHAWPPLGVFTAPTAGTVLCCHFLWMWSLPLPSATPAFTAASNQR